MDNEQVQPADAVGSSEGLGLAARLRRYVATGAGMPESRRLMEQSADEIERLRAALKTIAEQHSGEVCSTKRSDCMAAIAAVALRA